MVKTGKAPRFLCTKYESCSTKQDLITSLPRWEMGLPSARVLDLPNVVQCREARDGPIDDGDAYCIFTHSKERENFKLSDKLMGSALARRARI